MYLEKPARGHGLGKRMLKDLLDAARRGGFREVWLETNLVLTEAIALYRQHGFEPVESEHLLPRCDQAFLLRLDGEDRRRSWPSAHLRATNKET